MKERTVTSRVAAGGVAAALLLGFISGCGGDSSAARRAARCLARRGISLRLTNEEVEPSVTVPRLSGFVHGQLAQAWFSGLKRNARLAHITMDVELSDFDLLPGHHGRPRYARYGNVYVGWSSAPPPDERAAFAACLR